MAKNYVARGEVDSGNFKSLHTRSLELGENNDCAVKAIAVVCEVSYDEAHAALKAAGRKDRGTTHFDAIFTAVGALGKTSVANLYGYSKRYGADQLYETTPLETRLVERLETEYSYSVKNLTTRQLTMFPDLLDGETGAYLAFTRGHVVAIKDGKVHCWGARHALRIVETVEIV